MILCTLCGENEAPEPLTVEDDPLCADCIRAMLNRIADHQMAQVFDEDTTRIKDLMEEEGEDFDLDGILEQF